MDGLETTRRIRAWEATEGRRRIPILAVTANAMAGDRERCLEAGMDEFLSKPVALEDLGRVIQAHLALAPGVTPIPSGGRPEAVPLVTARATDDVGAVDPQRFAAFVADVGDDAIARSVVETFLRELAPRREAIVAAVHDGDHDARIRTAHVLRSAASLLGATGLAEVCHRIEHGLPGPELHAAVSELDEALPRSAAELGQLVAIL
jgi:DNA-binding response OmpR family regulator